VIGSGKSAADTSDDAVSGVSGAGAVQPNNNPATSKAERLTSNTGLAIFNGVVPVVKAGSFRALRTFIIIILLLSVFSLCIISLDELNTRYSVTILVL
jgi:hypothetical protein